MLEYSIIIPVFNEKENISQLNKEIIQAMKEISDNYETIYVNDCSTDGSLNQLKKLKKIKIIDLNRNYGQSTALDAGFKESKGKIIITLDADLQNDPKDIKKLLNKMKKDELDVVAGYRHKRKDTILIRILTLISRKFRALIIDDKIHDSGCTLRVYKKKCVDSINLQGEMHRYIIPILRWKGFSIGEEKVNHRPRIHGKSKYGISKCFRGFIDLIYVWFINKYYQRPLHLFGYFSLASFFFALFSGIISIYQKIIDNLGFNRNGWFFLAIFSFIVSLMLFSFGIILDLLIKIYLNASNEKQYIIKEIIKK